MLDLSVGFLSGVSRYSPFTILGEDGYLATINPNTTTFPREDDVKPHFRRHAHPGETFNILVTLRDVIGGVPGAYITKDNNPTEGLVHTVQWENVGDAIEGVDFISTTPKTLQFSRDNIEQNINIQLLPKAGWFKEKRIDIRLVNPVADPEGSDTFVLDPGLPGANFPGGILPANIFIRGGGDQVVVLLCPDANNEPPVISMELDGTRIEDHGDQIKATFTLSYTPIEDVTLYYKVTGDLEPYMVYPDSGTQKIIAGQTSKTITFTYQDEADAAPQYASFQISLDHERDTRVYRSDLLDPNTSLRRVEHYRHIDENLAPDSNGFDIKGFETDDYALNSSRTVTDIDGEPTQWIMGGPIADPGHEPGFFYDQLSDVKKKDPVTGHILKVLGADETASNYGDLIIAFHDLKGGGPFALEPLRRYIRHSMHIDFMEGSDAPRNFECHEISWRNRNKEIQHAVTFRNNFKYEGVGFDGTPGTDEDGNSVPVYTIDYNGTEVKFWKWRSSNIDGNTKYGVFKDDYGICLWISTLVDESTVWPEGNNISTTYPDGTPNGFVPKTDQPEKDITGWQNKVHASVGPAVSTWNGTDRTTQDLIDLSAGVLVHSFMREMRDTPFETDEPVYWPRLATRWTPRGYATKSGLIDNIERVVKRTITGTISGTKQYAQDISKKAKQDLIDTKENTRHGFSFPVGANERLFSKSGGNNLIKGQITQLFFTSPGERVMIPDFGLNLRMYLFEQLDDALIDKLKREITAQFRLYIPNAELLDLKVLQLPDDNSGQSLKIAITVVDKKNNEVIPLEFTI